MNAYEHSNSLGLTGTDAEIVAVLQTLGARDVSSQEIATWMLESRLWIVLPDGHAGTLYDLYAKTEDPQIKAGLGEWYASTLGGQAITIRATDPAIAARIAGIAGLIAVAIPDGQRLTGEFYEILGRPYAELTVDEFAKDREAAKAAATAEENAAASVVYDKRCVLLSVNASPQRTAVSCVVREAAVVDGQVKERSLLRTFATADAGVGKMSTAEQEFVTAIQAAIAKLVEA